MSNGTIVARLRKGAPMPHAITPYISEDIYERLRSDCNIANTKEDFMNVINRYNDTHRWAGAIHGQQEVNTVPGLLFWNIVTLGGLLGLSKSLRDRYLIINLPALISASRNAYAGGGGSVPAANVAVAVYAQPAGGTAAAPGYAQAPTAQVGYPQAAPVLYAQEQPQAYPQATPVYAQGQPQAAPGYTDPAAPPPSQYAYNNNGQPVNAKTMS